jgi:hypothetical protein
MTFSCVLIYLFLTNYYGVIMIKKNKILRSSQISIFLKIFKFKKILIHSVDFTKRFFVQLKLK